MNEPDHIITCVYCGQAYPEHTPTHGADVAVLTEHIRKCPKHPMRELEAKCAEMREAQIKFPDNLSALTVGLVLSFAQAMADKLSAAQIKHGYGDGWAETTHEWPIPECHEALMSHLKKGDPVDVANFCAFLWYHKIGTTDCGKGWRSPEDYAALEAKCEQLRSALKEALASLEFFALMTCDMPNKEFMAAHDVRQRIRVILMDQQP